MDLTDIFDMNASVNYKLLKRALNKIKLPKSTDGYKNTSSNILYAINVQTFMISETQFSSPIYNIHFVWINYITFMFHSKVS